LAIEQLQAHFLEYRPDSPPLAAVQGHPPPHTAGAKVPLAIDDALGQHHPLPLLAIETGGQIEIGWLQLQGVLPAVFVVAILSAGIDDPRRVAMAFDELADPFIERFYIYPSQLLRRTDFLEVVVDVHRKVVGEG